MNRMSEMEQEAARQARELLIWYEQNRRVLPWREDPTPYHVWLSEIMLQQTRVEAGKAYYLRFIEKLPDIAALAAAPEDVYLKLWEGLGYYSRVRNLHKAAVTIMEEYDGVMPGTAAELEKLPGIGPYSAAAIASIAFHQPVVSVDGNLLRVFARMTEYGEDIKTPAAKKAALVYYEELIPAAGERPGDFNQALMDLGAGICLPNGEPLCGECPWAERCEAHRKHRETEFPLVPEKKARRIEQRTVFLITAGGRVAIRRRPHTGLLADLYEFPNVEGQLRKAEAAEWVRGLLQHEAGEKPVYKAASESGKTAVRYSKDTGKEDGSRENRKSCVHGPHIRKLAGAKHIFSHIEWHMIGYTVQLSEVPESSAAEGAEELIWATREELESRYSIPSAFEAYRRAALAVLESGDR